MSKGGAYLYIILLSPVWLSRFFWESIKGAWELGDILYRIWEQGARK